VAGARNLISGNDEFGVLVDDGLGDPADSNVIQGNYIGTDVTGTLDWGNGFYGILLSGATNTLVGGNVAAARNIISGNDQYGVVITDPESIGNIVQGNYIGTNAAGRAAVANLIGGVRIADGASGNIVGGSTAGTRNVISGNNGDAVAITGVPGSPSNSNVISGNYIGTNAAGTAALGNNGDGVVIELGSNNVIGGTLAGWGNRIANNNGRGIVVFGFSGNRINGNLIYNNVGLGIDLGSDDVTANDLLDPDGGANLLQNYPVLTSARPVGGVRITGTLNSLASGFFRLEFFASPTCDASNHGEGQVFLGRTDVTTDGTGNVNFTVTLPGSVTTGWAITATATNLLSNDTSEFSRCIRYNLGIPAPLLLANGALTADTTPTLTWRAVTGAGDYRIQISTVNTFASLVVDAIVTPTTFTPGALAHGTYFWRVMARDAFGNDGPPSLVRSFTVSHLALPVLLTPANNAATGDTTPTFTWRAVAGATSYRIQIADISDFSSLIEDQGVAVTNFTPATPLPLGTYFWRVAPIDGAALEGAFSIVRTVRITFAPPVLRTPANGSITSDATPAFTWLEVPNATEYLIQVSTSNTFATGQTLFTGSTAPTYTLTTGEALTSQTIWYWRVAAVDTVGNIGSFSVARRFTFRLNPPTLTAPANNATVADTTPTFTWGVVPGAATYQIQFSLTSDFSILVLSGLTPANNYTPPIALSASETYYWRVVARDQYGNASAPSVVRRVNIGP
jgi:titin